jgi:lysophospholipase
MKYFDHFFQPKGWQEKTFTAKDGATLRYGHAAPAGESRGTVVITTGYADCIETYFDTIQSYLDRDYAVYIMDWAGQGGSAKKGSSPAADKAFGINEHMAHLDQFRHEIVGAAAGGKPVILSTHSLGGQIGLNYLQHKPAAFDAAILAAPLVDFGLSAQARAVLRAVFRYAAGAGLRDASLSGGRAGIQKQAINARKKIKKDEPVRIDLHRTFFMLAKPLGAEDPSVGLIDSLFESTARLSDEVALKSITTPVLLGLAGRDHIVNNDAIRRAGVLMPDARLLEIPEATHGIWADRPEVQRRWWAAVDSFLDEQHNRWRRQPPSAAPAAKKTPDRK